MISKEEKKFELGQIEAMLKLKEKEISENRIDYNRHIRARDKQKKSMVQNGLLGMAFGALTGVFATVGVATLIKGDVLDSVITLATSIGCGIASIINLKRASNHAVSEDRYNRWAREDSEKMEGLMKEHHDLSVDKETLEELIEQE